LFSLKDLDLKPKAKKSSRQVSALKFECEFKIVSLTPLQSLPFLEVARSLIRFAQPVFKFTAILPFFFLNNKKKLRLLHGKSGKTLFDVRA